MNGTTFYFFILKLPLIGNLGSYSQIRLASVPPSREETIFHILAVLPGIQVSMRNSDNRWYVNAVDSVPFSCVINTYQMHTSDKWNKCVHSIVVFKVLKFTLNK